MSYQVLARKWRPQTFADTVGQAHVRQALTNALESGRLHHAYLFTGTRGVGKTTLARILAKAFNCETGVNAEPCGECASCVEVDDGRFVDLIEVDAASRTKVDDTRELLDNVQYAPARGRYKVYLIDEVHMLSSHSFNALLKTLEEPPEHVKFLLATTDPQKLPVTVLSRCLQFNLTRLSPTLIRERMQKILTAEAIEFDESALQLLAEAAAGSMRDGLSLLDQAIAYGAGEVKEEATRRILGTVNRDDVKRLLEALSAGDGQALIATVADIDQHAPDYGRLLGEIGATLQRMALCQVIGADEHTDALVREAATSMSGEDIQLYYQIALTGKRDLHYAPDERAGFEMTLLRMLTFRPAGADPAAEPGPAAAPAQVAPQQSSAPPTASASVSTKQAGEEPVAEPPKNTTAIPDSPDWFRLVAELDVSGVERMLAGNCAWHGVQGHTVTLHLEERCAAQLTEPRRQTLEKALARHFKTELRLAIELQGGADTPTQRVVQQKQAVVDDAHRAIEADPNIRVMQELFGASVATDSIKPLEKPLDPGKDA